MADVLQEALGDGYQVVAFPPASQVIAVLTAAAPPVVAAHRRLYPRVGLVVAGSATSPTPSPQSSTPAPTTVSGRPSHASSPPGSRP